MLTAHRDGGLTGFATFAVLVMPFAPSTSTLAGRLASGGEVGLRRGLPPHLVRLRDGCGISRIGHTAEALLRRPVKLLRLGVAGGESRRGGV